MNSRNTIIAVVLVLAVVIVGYLVINPRSGGPSVTTQEGDQHYTEDTQYYTINVTYPAQTALALRAGAQEGANTKASQAIEAAVQSMVGEFKQVADPANLSQEEKDRLTAGGIKYSLDAIYHAYSSSAFISYEFEVSTDTGGAHPNTFYKTLVFDMSGNTVALGDLFTSPNYLTRISQAANTQVAQQLSTQSGSAAAEAIIAEGLAAKVENFQNFVITDDMLKIFIPPYQAAAYAAGSFEVDIPLSSLSDILKETVAGQ